MSGHWADEEPVAMALRWYSIVVDSEDHRGVAGWWADVLGWRVTYADEEEASVALPAGPAARARSRGCGSCPCPR